MLVDPPVATVPDSASVEAEAAAEEEEAAVEEEAAAELEEAEPPQPVRHRAIIAPAQSTETIFFMLNRSFRFDFARIFLFGLLC